MSRYPWFRVYSNDLLSDRKLSRVSRVTKQPPVVIRGVWLTLMAMANDSPERGKLLIAEDLPVTDGEIADDLGLDDDVLEAILVEFERLNMIERGECLALVHFLDRNPNSDSSTERVKRHRARKRREDGNVTGTLQEQPGNVIESESESEEELEEESEEHGTATPPANAGTPPARSYDEWHEYIRSSKNRPAALREMCISLYPKLDPPDYGRIGKVAKQVGGAGRLCDLLWQRVPHPPTGDLMSYILAVSKGNGRNGGKSSVDTTMEALHILEQEAANANNGY